MKPMETACKTRFLCVLYALGQTFSLQTALPVAATPADNCAHLLPTHIARSRVLCNLRQTAFLSLTFSLSVSSARAPALARYAYIIFIIILLPVLCTFNI